MPWRSVADWGTNLIIVITCGVVLTIALGDHRASTATPTLPAGLAAGTPATALPGVDYTGRRTLVLYLRSTCDYCTQSMPFYRTLSEARADGGFYLVAAGSEEVVRLSGYLATHGVNVDDVVSVAAGVPTPTAVLVDERGAVRGSWVGRQSAEGEVEIVNELERND